MSNYIFDSITDRILKLLEKGIVPWRKTWNAGETEPQNLVTKKKYRGINFFLLRCLETRSAYFMTFNQAKKAGGHVVKGAKGYPVVFWKFDRDEKIEENGEIKLKKSTPILRSYTVFSVADIEGLPDGMIPEPPEQKEIGSIESAEAVVKEMPKRPKINHGGARAFYRPGDDSVTMPPKGSFEKAEEYYSTLFHELVHSTGHEARLNRKSITAHSFFGDGDYSREELVAEMGATFLCGYCGIEAATIDNAAAYIDAWIKTLKADNRAVVVAAGQAHKAADFILNVKEEK